MDSLPPQQFNISFKVALIISGVMLLLCIINTLAKTASIVINDAKLKQLSDDGNRKAKRLYSMLERNSTALIDSIEFCSIILAVIPSVLAVYYVYITTKTIFINTALQILFFVVGIIILCILYTVIVILVPKRIASKYADKLALGLSGYSKMILYVMKPVMGITNLFAKLFYFIFRVNNTDSEGEVTEEEIRMMVDMGSETGAIDDDEKQMIHNIFEMNDKPVEDIMTHRIEACVLWIEDSIEEWKKYIDETNHTRYPVCGESIDDVIGVIRSRDFYRLLLSGENDVRTIIREAFFIPDTIKADELLSRMQEENENIGIVMDEYGGFQGIVTQEDLIEEIVGELYSEYDEPEAEDEEILKIDDETWSIDGFAEIEDVEEALGIKIEDGDYNTLAGFILNEIQAIPADGDVFELETNGMYIKVISVVDHRIEKALVQLVSNEDKESDSEGEE